MKTHTYNKGDLAVEMDLYIGVPYFERLYICWAGCKKGFLAGCRPIIGLDSCHLKTKMMGGGWGGGAVDCCSGKGPQ